MRTLPRRDLGDIAETMFLRPKRPDDHREFNSLLPWLTPLFVYEMNGGDWVRWSVPRNVAAGWGLTGGCVCCGEGRAASGDSGDFHVDTALAETDWWLTANDYRVLQNATSDPTEKEGTPNV